MQEQPFVMKIPWPPKILRKKKKKIKSASDKKGKSNPTHYKIKLKFFCENIYLYIP